MLRESRRTAVCTFIRLALLIAGTDVCAVLVSISGSANSQPQAEFTREGFMIERHSGT